MIYRSNKLLDGTEGYAAFSECMTYRYLLSRSWYPQGKKRLVFVLLNPSTATEETDDPTISRCVKRARDGGYNGVTIINLFAYRATSPEAMKKAAEPTGGYETIHIWQTHLAGVQAGNSDIICGWGRHGSFKRRDEEILGWFAHYAIEPMALKVGKDGHPCHPLYLPYSLTAKPMREHAKAA